MKSLLLCEQSRMRQVQRNNDVGTLPVLQRGAALPSRLLCAFTGRVVTQLAQLGGNLDIKIKYQHAAPLSGVCLGPCTTRGAHAAGRW